MRKIILLLSISIFTVALVAALGANDKIQNGELIKANENTINTNALFPIIPVPKIPVPDTPLPKSLDNLFPPKTQGPIWLFEMLELGEDFLSIPVDLSENDPQNASAHFEKFKAQYEETGKMVPEWEPFFPMYPVNSLEAALKSGDQKEVNAAIANMGQVCENCHLVNMPKVQQKYHWKTFDGKTFMEIYPQLMKDIDFTFNGVVVDVEKNQRDNAKKHFMGFNATFQVMKETCKNCHTTERKYYVGSSVQGMIDDMGQALNEPSVNVTKVKALSQGIGQESCFKCHLVHIPAALAQNREK